MPPAPLPHRVLALLVRALLWTGRVLPGWLTYGAADVLAPIYGLWVLARDRGGKRSRGFHRNYRIVFRRPSRGPHARRLAFAYARHMTHLIVDFCRQPLITADNVHDFADCSEMERLRTGPCRDGFICATGHMGIPDLTAHIGTVLGFPLAAIYSSAPLAPITAEIDRVRTSGGQEVIAKEGALRPAWRALARNKNLGVAVDVSAKTDSVWAPFLGTMAATNASAAAIARRSGRPLAVVTCQRLSRGRYKMCVWDVILPEPTADRDADLRRLMTRINAALSRAILTRPEQWFWHSRRFRRRPPGEVPDADGLPPVVGDWPEAFWVQEPVANVR